MTARLLSVGMPALGLGVLAMSGLPTRRLPAANLSLKLGVLAAALVPPAGLVLASTPLEETNPRARSSSSGRSAGLGGTLTGAHGRGHSQGKSSGRMQSHSLRALSKLERNAYWPVYRFLENETGEKPSRRHPGNKTPERCPSTNVFSRTRRRDKRSHQRPGNKTPERCPSNDRLLGNKSAR